MFDDGGYWVISRHEDIKAISKNNDAWSTNAKGAVMRFPEGMTNEQLELTKALLINHDAPAHTRLRKLVSRLFTPRAVASLEDKLAKAAHEIVVAAAEKETGNFVDDIAMSLPLLAIADLIGVPGGRPRAALSLDQLDHEHRRSGLRRRPDRGQCRADGLRLHDGRGTQALPGRRHRHQADRGRHRRGRATTSSSRSSSSCSPWQATRPHATR